MKIVSWNCHYGLDKTKFEQIMKDKTFGDADIYAFQEVLENEFIDIAAFDESKDYIYRHWYGDHQEYGNCHIPRGEEGDLGIVLMSKKYRIQRFDQGLIRFRYVVPYIMLEKKEETEKEKFILIHVWTKGKPDGYIEPIYKALNYYKNQIEQKKLPIVMVGDFNFGVKFEDSFLCDFQKEISKSIPNLKMLNINTSCKNRQTFYFPKCSKTPYFNDTIYTRNCVGEMIIGNTKDWIKALGATEDLSDHCPIMAELELQ